jgi:hypothetical protein
MVVGEVEADVGVEPDDGVGTVCAGIPAASSRGDCGANPERAEWSEFAFAFAFAFIVVVLALALALDVKLKVVIASNGNRDNASVCVAMILQGERV